MHSTEDCLSGLGIHTVCHQARCPNIAECFQNRTATFIILGDTCTRGCAFCAVSKGTPMPPDPNEPRAVAEAASRLGLRHVVVTSVTRDDLPDGGAAYFAATINRLRFALPDARVEVLVPDFLGKEESIRTVIEAEPDIFAHNIETVPAIYRTRPGSDYYRSLAVLATVKRINPSIKTKSAILLGMGETDEEVKRTLHDLRTAGCDLLAIGQYLRPGAANLPVARYVAPEHFEHWRETAIGMGYLHVESGPYVRSSYHAADYLPPDDGARNEAM